MKQEALGGGKPKLVTGLQEREAKLLAALDETQGALNEAEAKLARALEGFNEILDHCRNSGAGNPAVDARIVERCEETASAYLSELENK